MLFQRRLKSALLVLVYFAISQVSRVAISGVLYVSNDAPNYGDSTIVRITANGTKAPILGGLNYPAGLAVDSPGNLYVANFVDGSITRITPSGVASPFAVAPYPYGLTVDANNNLYVSHFGPASVSQANTISKITPNGQVSTYGTALHTPSGIAFNASGELFVANRDIGTIAKVAPGGGVASTFATGIDQPNGLAFDSLGNLYVAEWGTNSILKLNGDGTKQPFATVGFHPVGLAFDDLGNLFAANYDGGSISQITPGGQVSTFATGFTGANFLAWSSVPEPSTTLGSAFFALLARRWRRK